MTKLKVAYRNFWQGFDPNKMPQDYFFEYALSHKYEVETVEKEPDVVFISLFGEPVSRSEYSEGTLFVGFSGEPYDIQGDFDLTFDFNLSDNPNKFYLPLWAMYLIWDNNPEVEYRKLIGQGSHHIQTETLDNYDTNPLRVTNILHRKSNLNKSKFCNFTYRNTIKSRIEFFKRLNDYKKVDSTGGLLNNTGYRMVNKSRELADYKFTIAFENTLKPNYVTEKLLEPLAAGSVPIYYGGETAFQYFNKDAVIYAQDYENLATLKDAVVDIDNNQYVYEYLLDQPVFKQLPDFPKLVCDRIAKELE